MADGAEIHGLELAEFVGGAVGQHFAGAQIAVAAKIVMMPVQLEIELAGRGLGHFERFSGDFRSGAVARRTAISYVFMRNLCGPRFRSGGMTIAAPAWPGNVI